MSRSFEWNEGYNSGLEFAFNCESNENPYDIDSEPEKYIEWENGFETALADS